MPKIKSAQKIAAGLVLAGITLAGAMSLTAAGDDEVIVPTPIVEPQPADPAPVVPEPTPEPAEPSPEPVEPSPTPEPEPELTPIPEPPFDYEEAVPWVPGAPIGDLPPEVIHEDDPRWDCRVMGDYQCGVEIHGVTYVITFDQGNPAAVRQR